jgi:hypothetical protein
MGGVARDDWQFFPYIVEPLTLKYLQTESQTNKQTNLNTRGVLLYRQTKDTGGEKKVCELRMRHYGSAIIYNYQIARLMGQQIPRFKSPYASRRELRLKCCKSNEIVDAGRPICCSRYGHLYPSGWTNI